MMELAFREYGSGEPMIILHGLFGQSDNWNTLAKKFADDGRRVFTIDQRNHGLSGHSDDWTYEDMAADLKKFIDQHQLVNPILLGHSMGAKTVLFFEKNFPGLAAKLIIADMSARQYEAHHGEVLNALNAVNFDQISTRKEAEAVLSEFIPDFGTKQFLLKNIYWKDTADKKMAWRFNLKVITEKYDEVRVPVPFFESKTPALVIRGQKSGYVNEADITDFGKRFSDVQFKTIEGAGHWVHAEKPEEFYQAVSAFIEA